MSFTRDAMVLYLYRHRFIGVTLKMVDEFNFEHHILTIGDIDTSCTDFVLSYETVHSSHHIEQRMILATHC